MRTKAIVALALTVLLLAACEEGGGGLAGSGRDAADTRRAKEPREPRGGRDERAKEAKAKKRPPKPPRSRPKVSKRQVRGPLAYVTRIVDGDTVEVDLHGVETGVRLIGFDTPETVHPSQPVECFGKAASAYTSRSLEGRRVRLEFDVEKADHYGRTLAYVWLDDRLFNERILRHGFAQVSTYPPNVKYVDRFLAAQRSARSAEKGLWSRCRGGNEEASEPAAGEGAAQLSGSNGKCDPNYSGACVPSYPPDIDCPDVPAVDFRSKGSDPHGFDGDADGIACES